MIPRRKPFFHKKTLDKIIDLTIKSDETSKLARDIANYLKIPNPLVVGQGRMGLKLILETSDIPKGAEILMPGYTFGTLTKIISDSGYTPKPVDIDYYSYQMSIESAKKAVTKKTGAILATHLFGQACDIKKFQKLAKKHKLLLIEDCAQALGSTLDKKLLGTFGDIAFSSFDMSKPLQGVRGGVIFGKNRKHINKIKLKIRSTKHEGKTVLPELTKALVGYVLIHTPLWFVMMYIFGYKKYQKMFVDAYRHGEDNNIHQIMPSVFARIVRMNLPSLSKRLEKRRKIRNLYYSLLKKDFKFQKAEKGNLGSYYMILVHTKLDIFALRRYLASKGVDIGLADEIADNCLKAAKSNVRTSIEDSIALPVYEGLKESEVIRVANLIKAFAKKKQSTSTVI